MEANEELCNLARHNFGMLGFKHIHIHNLTSEAFLAGCQRNFDAIYIDPSRRSDHKKVFKIDECAPNLYDILPKCKRISSRTLVKLSPLVDISFLIIKFQPSAIWIIAVKNEVKEVLCLIQNGKIHQVRIEAVNFTANSDRREFKFLYHKESEAKSEFSFPLEYLYEPDGSILKAGAFKLIGNHFGLKKLQQHTHLYTSKDLVKDFPGRIFRIMENMKLDKKEILASIPDKKINVLTRNFPLTPAQLKKKFALTDGGEDFLIGTTLLDGKKVLLKCGRLHQPPSQ